MKAVELSTSQHIRRLLRLFLEHRMVHDVWSLPDSPLFEIRSTPTAGQGVFARVDLHAGTHILTTSPLLSPIAHVLLRPYRREVCAFCFAYDRGKEWKIRVPRTSLSFCSQRCIEDWNHGFTTTHLDALRTVEASTQRQQRHHGDSMEVDSDEKLNWNGAVEVRAAITRAQSARPSKHERRLLALHADARVEPDILNFLLSGCLTISSRDLKFASLLALADNPSVYATASLHDHVQAYLHLLATLPDFLPYIRPDVCHELISRASHNAFSIRPTTDGEQSGEFLGYGVWPEASFFNHSCRPNLAKERQGRLWSFHTSRNVSAGEELSITYLGGDEKDFDVVGRRRRLEEEWGFLCQCYTCLEEASAADVSK